MDNHPIPQDVTGFQFKLIGNMTVKQFAYLATGIIVGWIFLQAPLSIFMKFPLSVLFAISGIGLAFFSISGRPVDAMIGNFIKALFRPTQFVYEKTGGLDYFPKTRVILATSLPPQQKDKLKAYLSSQAAQRPTLTLANNIIPTASINSLKPVSAPPPIVEPPAQKPIALAKSFNKNIGLPNVPDSPNLIIGITKDARGNALPNILIEIKDKENNPVRAFKTNEFGRFASATPLMNGSYTIELEDPKGQNKFEKGIINVTGQIIQPLAIISIDTREELRRSLFSPDASGLNN